MMCSQKNTKKEDVNVDKCLEQARVLIGQRKVLDFIEALSYAAILAKDDPEVYAQILYFKAAGLCQLKEHQKSLEVIEEALKFNTGDQRVRLLKYKGLILGNEGRFAEALKIFKNLTKETTDTQLLAEIYSNIVWVNLTMTQAKDMEDALDEAKYYLDLLNQSFDTLDKVYQRITLVNLADYHMLKGDSRKAIEVLEKSIQYCEVSHLAGIYNRLAGLYVQLNDTNRAEEYLHKAEVTGNKDNNYLEVGKALYTKGIIELQTGDWLKAADAFYVALNISGLRKIMQMLLKAQRR